MATIRCSGIPVLASEHTIAFVRDVACRWRVAARAELPRAVFGKGRWQLMSRRTISRRPVGFSSPVAGREADQVLSEIRVQTLVRPSMKRRLLRRAGSIRCSNAACRGLTPDPATPVRAVAGSGVDASPVRGESLDQKTQSCCARPYGQRDTRQRTARLLGRVRPSSTCLACHRSISGRSHRLGRPRPRSRTGRGMSGYRCTYWLTVFR
jgi:hypothetical protein